MTGTDMETHILRLLSDGRVWTVDEIYRAVENGKVLSDADRARLPTTAGYRKLRSMGYEIKGLINSQKQALAEEHDLPSEPHYKNAIRQALRQLRPRKGGKSLIESVGVGKIRLLAPRRSSDPYQPLTDTLFEPDSYLASADGEELPANVTELPGPAYVPSAEDSRSMIMRAIRVRRGQSAFRQALRARYGDTCLVSGCNWVDVLEAAHIVSYRGVHDNHPENGLLLRADIHVLFDLDLMGIEPQSLTVYFHPMAVSSAYLEFEGVRLRCMSNLRPSEDALGPRWQLFQERKRSYKNSR
jgi:hypothetical protein